MVASQPMYSCTLRATRRGLGSRSPRSVLPALSGLLQTLNPFSFSSTEYHFLSVTWYENVGKQDKFQQNSTAKIAPLVPHPQTWTKPPPQRSAALQEERQVADHLSPDPEKRSCQKQTVAPRRSPALGTCPQLAHKLETVLLPCNWPTPRRGLLCFRFCLNYFTRQLYTLPSVT